MSEKDTPEAGECQHVSYHIPKWTEDGKCHWDDVQLQPKSFNAEAKVYFAAQKNYPRYFYPWDNGNEFNVKRR